MGLKSKWRGAGYFQIDHRDSPGLTDDEIVQCGGPVPLGQGRANFEADVVKCWHCQTMIILNPLRTRGRHFCYGCDHYICDNCYLDYKVSGVCRSFLKVIDEILESAIKATLIKEI